MTLRDKLLHPATFISLLALFVALGGAGYAAVKIGTKELENRAVTAKKLRGNSVTSPKIRPGAVRGRDIATSAVSTDELQDDAVDSDKLADGSVFTGRLADGAVTTLKLADGAVTPVKLADGAIGSDKLSANSVTGAAIAPDAIGAGQIADGQVVEGNGVLTSVELGVDTGTTDALVLDFPGLGTLRIDCTAGRGELDFLNTAAAAIDVRRWGVVGLAGAPPDQAVMESDSPAPGGAVSLSSEPNGIMGTTWMASSGGAAARLATIHASTKNLGGRFCIVTAQATYAG